VKTIFVLDDDADAAEVMAQGLTGHGREVRFFADPTRALAALDDQAPDLLLVDLAMPFMGGLEVVRRARAKCPGCAVFLVSGADDLAELAERGGYRYFRKPIDLARLRHAAEQVLGSDEAVQELHT